VSSDATIRMHAPVVRDDGVADRVAIEEPLEIRVRGRALAVTMRTPGHDEDLAAGFLHGEGLLAGPITSIGPAPDLAANTVDVHAERLGPGPAIDRALLAVLPDRLRQPGFDVTGGLHATGLFDPAGTLLCVREDVGRHNAMDKVIGRALLHGDLPLTDRILCVSGRLSFELVQKAAVAGCPILVGVGAPSSLAVELAADRSMTLAGFARGGRVNVYAGAERVRPGS
jgi:FdhD protein